MSFLLLTFGKNNLLRMTRSCSHRRCGIIIGGMAMEWSSYSSMRHMFPTKQCAFITPFSSSSSSSSSSSRHTQSPSSTTTTTTTTNIRQQLQRIRPPTQQRQLERRRKPQTSRTMRMIDTELQLSESMDENTTTTTTTMEDATAEDAPPTRNETNITTIISLNSQNNNDDDEWSERLFVDETIRICLRIATDRLRRNNVTDPYYSARALLSWTLQLEWEAGYRDLDQDAFLQDCTLTEEGGREYFGYIQRRLNHEPIQYILGQWDFLDYTLRIRPPLLCPRPETEELVELILDDIDPDQRLTTPTQLTNIIISDHHDENKDAPNMPSMRILDVGCGTGCIGIALADRILYSLVDAIDIDPVAIETSTENANCILGESKPRVDCLYRNKKLWIKQNNVANQYDREYVHPQAEKERYLAILSSIQDYHPPYRYDLVVSNPPYIPQSDMPSLDPTVAQHESYHALCGGGPDGMDVIRSLVRKLPQWCVPGGICWIECDPSHPPILQTWLENNNNNEDDLRVRFVQMERDMFGLLRFVKLQVV